MLDTIILIGRPAAGKSEVLDYLGSMTDAERLERVGLGPVEMHDDFPYLWEKFEEDDILARHGRPRIWTDDRKFMTDDFFWTFMLEKVNLAFRKGLARDPEGFGGRTKIIEFSRGGERGYEVALPCLCDEILDRASILYIKVSFEESLRRNRKRARPGLEDSILYHSLPDAKLALYYEVDDWDRLSGGKDDGAIEVRGRRLAFANLRNEPEVTDDPAKLGPALATALTRMGRAR